MLDEKNFSEALLIPTVESKTLRLDDCRRMTGPGQYWGRTGAVADIYFTNHDPKLVDRLWHKHARKVLDGIGWQDEELTVRHFDGGANLVLSGPLDQLYTAAFSAETAWHFCAAELLGQPSGDFDAMIQDLRGLAARESNTTLMEIVTAAEKRGIDVLFDDDELSIGHGNGSVTWALAHLPQPQDISWASVHNIPLALITGTNGKTTTTRLCAAIARKADLVSGLSSTDGVWIGDTVLGEGDFSGPAGARLLLRHPDVQIAALEVARGGILRRGLPVRFATVAVVTNVAADHLGHYGINTVPELAKVKMSIRRGLKPGGILVLNADDSHIVAEAEHLKERIWWFSLEAGCGQVVASCAHGHPCAWHDGSGIVVFDGVAAKTLIKASDVPIALSGSARYNLQNAMAAALASRALGIADDAITQVLASFRNNPNDNPGRCNEFAWNGARVFVDFAHNPHSIAAVTSALHSLPARRRFLLISHAGDRSDQDIKDLALGANTMRPDSIVIAENPGYLRGRAPGEVPGIIRDAFLRLGLNADAIRASASPGPGAAMILESLQPGDLALLLVHADRDQIFAMLDGTSVA